MNKPSLPDLAAFSAYDCHNTTTAELCSLAQLCHSPEALYKARFQLTKSIEATEKLIQGQFIERNLLELKRSYIDERLAQLALDASGSEEYS